MRIRSSLSAAVAALAVAVPALTDAAFAQSSPLSQSYSPLYGSYRGSTTQAPALWYYGPSYSSNYYVPPNASAGASTYYTPSLGYDSFYGYGHNDYYGYGAPERWRRY